MFLCVREEERLSLVQVDLILCLSFTLFKYGVELLCCHASSPFEVLYNGLIQVFIC